MTLTAEQRYRQAMMKTRLQSVRLIRQWKAGKSYFVERPSERENLIAEIERAYRAGLQDGRRA